MGNSKSKIRDLLLILLFYVLSYIGSYFLTSIFKIEDTILFVLIWDLFSTLFIFIFSIIFKNSSIYDPYWSVTPLLVCIYLMVINQVFSIMHFFLLGGVLFWSARLTINWVIVTTGFSYEDWRYKHFREISKNKFEWFIYNFFGIHFVPTIFVFLGMLPLFDIFQKGVNLSLFSIFGVIIMIIGVILELLSDIQVHHFLNSTKEKKTCNYGLWKYSRHPNYLGEITFWLGIFVAMIISVQSHPYFVIGFLGMVFMFNIISIPLMEKRQIKRRSDYQQYIKVTHRLLVLPTKNRLHNKI